MAVSITIAAVQNLGMIASSDGKKHQSWKVMVHLEREGFSRGQISIPVSGVATSQEAKKSAVNVLQHFLSEAYAAAKNDEIREFR
jgi:hypothetical protein